MFAADVVIIFIVLIGVSYILFGKKKDVKEDSKILDFILDIIMNIIIYLVVIAIFFPWVLVLLFYVFGFLALHVIPY